MYNEKYLKTKLKSYNDKIKTNFYDNDVPKEGSHFVYFSVPLIDSVFKIGRNYYPLDFLEECKYMLKENNMNKFINDKLKQFILKFLMKSRLKLTIMRVFSIIAGWMAAKLKIFMVLKWFEVI